MRQLMRLSNLDRLVRVSLGAGLLTYFAFFPEAYWALLGLLPLLTALADACPLHVLRRRPLALAAAGPMLVATPPPETAPAPSAPRPLHRTRKKMKRQSSGRPRARAAGQGAAGKVAQVTDGTFDAQVLRSETPVLVDFWADWCGPCRVMAPILDEVAAELGASARVVKLDVERNPITGGRYGIRNIPTLLLFAGGQVKDVLVGVQSKDKLLRLLQRAAA